MRIAIVTNQAPHHKHLVVELAKRHNVVGVIHPAGKRNGKERNRERQRRMIKRYGIVHYTIKRMASTRLNLGWNLIRDYGSQEQAFFSAATAAYDEVVDGLIHHNLEVNSPAGLACVHGLQPDVVVCLGGTIYRKPFIEACPLLLNFHSGLSPIYNGSNTINFAFANGHPHLCGGTLMTMSPVIDGGDVLAHYLTSIESQDTPGSIFMKTIQGAVHLYDSFLTHLSARGDYVRTPQRAPLFYYREMDWTVLQNYQVERAMAAGLVTRFARDARSIEYWRSNSEAEARSLLDETLGTLLQA